MDPMDLPDRERWQRIEVLIDAALDLPAAGREEFLRGVCGADTALLEEILALLAAAERPNPLLDAPAAAFAADLLAVGERAIDEPETPHERVGAWRLVDELGRGGMGTVYLAEREEHFRQRAALKVIRRGLRVDDMLVRRFLEERQILASLEHANIARLLDGGVTPAGDPWFAMELVEGQPIDRWCDAQRLTIEARLALFCTVCDAVEYAHRRQVIHRDLKPSNILVRADGVVKLLDFGVAKLLTPDDAPRDHLTRTGLRLLTPEYASPEQIRGEPAGPSSDVYSLGVLLYELMTGQRPYRSTGAGSSLEHAVLTEDPERPSAAIARSTRDGATPVQIARARDATPDRLRVRLRGALDDIILEALSKDPKRRYADVGALARDVRRHLEGSPVHARRRSRVRSRAVRVALLVLPLAVALGLWLHSLGTAPAGAPIVLAVGMISDYRDAAATNDARPVADLLATNLARVRSLRVVSTSRMYELMAQHGAGGDPGAGEYSAAARRAGATELLDGALFAANGELRLDLRRIEVSSGSVMAAHSVSGPSIFALVDRGTDWLASEIGLRRPDGSIADVTTRSESAYRFYEAGLRAWHRGDLPAARGLFEAAFREDSMFAMAAYHLMRTDPRRSLEYMRRALDLAPRASDRERLIIETEWGLLTADPRVVATAESLAVRFPIELDGQHFAAQALARSGDYPAALSRLRNVIAADSLGLIGSDTPCRRCSARRDVIDAYMAMDSLGAAEREARVWTTVQPAATTPWLMLGEALVLQGRHQAGGEAYRVAAQIDASLNARPDFFVAYGLAGNEFEDVDRQLRAIIETGSPDRQSDAYWYLGHSLRRQGRVAEALDAYRGYRTISAAARPAVSPLQFAMEELQSLFELQRFAEATSLLDSMAAQEPGQSPSHRASRRIGLLVRRANILAASGNLDGLPAIIDTLRMLGPESLLSGDQRAHHYVQGLLLARRGDDAAAVESFRRAIASPVFGDPRTKSELAESLLRLGRAREAVAVMQPVLRAPLGVTSVRFTVTALEELLARGWDAAGVRDSALVHYRAALHAWRRADAAFTDRVSAVRTRIAALEATGR